MTYSAITWVRLWATLAILVPGAASGQGANPRPVTDHTVTAQDVATTPLTDLNMKKNPVPQVLVDAIQHPYDLTGLNNCTQILGAVGKLDAVLGEDLDVQKAKGEKLTAGSLSKAVVSAFIPFEGVIRQVSGAAVAKAKMQLAIHAGSERRAFLKGIGVMRGCPYPARPATPDVIAAHDHALAQKHGH